MNPYLFNGEQTFNWLSSSPFADEAMLETLEPVLEDFTYSRKFASEYESPFSV